MIELEPAAHTLAALVVGVRDDQLALPTPCEGMDLAGLLNHIDESCVIVAESAPLLDRLIGLSGRDPAWVPNAALVQS